MEAIDAAYDAMLRATTAGRAGTAAGRRGRIERPDLVALLRASARHTGLDGRRSVMEELADALILDARYAAGGEENEEEEDEEDEEDEEAGGGGVGGKDAGITREQFHDIFARHPDMLAVFEDDDDDDYDVGGGATGASAASSGVVSPRRGGGASSSRAIRADAGGGLDESHEEEGDGKIYRIWVTRWKNRRLRTTWIALYLTANVVAFARKASEYARRDEALAVFGGCIVVARGCAAALNLNALLVLLLSCKHLTTFLRRTRLRFYFPFDATGEAHVAIGAAFALLAASHTAGHVCDFDRMARRASRADLGALFGEEVARGIPESPEGRWAYMMGSRAGITGVVMVACMAVAYGFALGRARHFNRFCYSHHLLLVMMIALCVHGTGNLLEPFQSVYWVVGPLVLYALPRVMRETPLSAVNVVRAEVKKGDVVRLRLKKPRYYNGYVTPGMYGYLNVPQVSRTEWHPFTFTSAPSEEFVEFHFRPVGDWTRKVHDLLESKSDVREPTGIKDAPVIKLEGPIGASSQGFSDYSVVVLVGAGIGVTPMISVLKQLLAARGKTRRCYFYWTVRDRDSFLWFTDLMDEIVEADKRNLIQLRHFLTSARHDHRDLGAVLLHHAMRTHRKRTNVDLLRGQQIAVVGTTRYLLRHQPNVFRRVEVGRPDWQEELEGVREETESLGESKCGIFLCGPAKMAEEVYEASVKVSKRSPRFHMFFSKETF